MIGARPILFTFFVLSLFAGDLGAGDLPPDLLERLQNNHENIQNVSGTFVQEKRLAMFEQPLISKGSFAVAKPGKIHWAYEHPASFGFASDGKNVRRWNRESGESASRPLDRDPVLSVIVDQMLAWSTMDMQTIDRYFAVSLVESQPVLLGLKPKTDQLKGLIKRVRITFDSAGKYITKIRITEHEGDETVIRFDKVKLNRELPAGLF
ncbi:MAG: outer membrane lipoprotein carrier protein LolA [Desulfonatronovibrio sp.]